MARKLNLQDKQVKIKRFYKLRIGRLVVGKVNKVNEEFMVEIDGFFQRSLQRNVFLGFMVKLRTMVKDGEQ